MLRRVMLGKGNVGETRMYHRKGKEKEIKRTGNRKGEKKKSEDGKEVKEEL